MKPPALTHQTEANAKLNPLHYGALFADMGTGKTRIAIDWAIDKHQKYNTNKVVVIAPSVVSHQWVDEQLPIHCDAHYKAHAFESKNTQKYLKKLDNFVMSAKYGEGLHILCIHFETFASPKGFDIVKNFIGNEQRPVIIVDESSRIKNPDAKSVKSITLLRKFFPESFRLVMSGTPASKSPVDLWSQFNFLTYNFFNHGYVAMKSIYTVRSNKKMQIKGRLVSIETTLDKYTYDRIKALIVKNTKNGKLQEEIPLLCQQRFGITPEDFYFVMSSERFTRFKNMDKLKEIIAPITYAVKRSDCVDLPPKIYKRIQCKLNPNQKKLIKELVQYSATVYDDKTLTIDVKALLGLRVLQICGGNFSHITDIEGEFATKPIKGANHKLEYLKKDVPEIGDQQFIVCAVYTPEILTISKELMRITDIGVLYGGTPEQERKRAVEDFKAGHLQGLVMNPLVGGFGLNLQNASVMYIYSRDYRTEVRLQTEDRMHRIGTKVSPVYKDLVSEISYEDKVLEVLSEGKSINDIFVNTDINKLFKV